MTAIRSPLSLIKRVALPAVGLLIVANFIGYAVVGPNGVMSWGDYRRAKAERTIELARLETERTRLQQRARLLDPRGADPDLADELVRRELGLVGPNEIIIDMRAAPDTPNGLPAGAR